MVSAIKVSNKKFDMKPVKDILIRENNFITNLFSMLSLPTSSTAEDENNEENESKSSQSKFHNNQQHEKSRAQSLTELQERLNTVKSKKRLNYKEKLLKKGLQNRLKKKVKREERNMKQKLVRMEKLNGTKVESDANGDTTSEKLKPNKPVFNREGKMVFSKFDFSGLGQKNEKKSEKDPKKILQNLERQKAKISELEEAGEKEKAIELKEKTLWKNALAKSSGEKIKDDSMLLKKTIKKREQQLKSNQKKWKERKDGVQKAQDVRQQKRQENIDKRKKEKKVKKMKQAAKRGRIIPGF